MGRIADGVGGKVPVPAVSGLVLEEIEDNGAILIVPIPVARS
jgi:hypothetical protein